MEGVVQEGAAQDSNKTVAGKLSSVFCNLHTIDGRHGLRLEVPDSTSVELQCPELTWGFVSTWMSANMILDIRANFSLLERAVLQFDSRFTLRAIRLISTLRKRLDDVTLCEVIALTYPPGHRTASVLIKATGIDGDAFQKILKNVESATNGGAQIAKNEVIPEIDIYIAILIQVGFNQ
jgi:hypothetical protein